MPRRNLYILAAIAVVSFACYQKANGRYARWFDTMAAVAQHVDRDFVDDIEPRDMFEGALDGMVSRLDDYSAYYPPRAAEESRASLDQEFGGIGIEVLFDPETRVPTVMNPIYGTPAYEGGIEGGDRIVAVDGAPTEGISLRECTNLLRGPKGKPVTLRIEREGLSEPFDVTLVRDVIQVQSVLGDTRKADGKWNFLLPGADKIGYIRITQFGQKTVEELRAALETLSKEGMRGLILDLRDDSGGLLDAAVAMCDLFVKEGVIVSTRARGGVVDQTYSATGKAPYPDVPLVVLINGRSASASEIVAACLQDYDRATVIGSRSYGKGTVQRIFLLEGGRSELRLTTATYWRPSGRNINRARDAAETADWGVRPDPGYEVALEGEPLKAWLKARRERDHLPKGQAPTTASPDLSFDPALEKAVEHIREQLTAPAIAVRV